MEIVAADREGKIKKDNVVKGIKRMRAGATSNIPTHQCENCKCTRYNACGCMRSKTSKAE